MLKTYNLTVFKIILKMFARLARIRIFAGIVRLIMRRMAGLVHWANGAPRANTPKDLARIWQQLMPSQNEFPVQGQAGFDSTWSPENKSKTQTNAVALGQIHLHCPLRGSDNSLACHHLMEFDRELIRKSGGELRVLDSQSSSGRNYCTVAVRTVADARSATDSTLP